MCYIIAKRLKQSGCIALKARREYEPYHFVHSFKEFESAAHMLLR